MRDARKVRVGTVCSRSGRLLTEDGIIISSATADNDEGTKNARWKAINQNARGHRQLVRVHTRGARGVKKLLQRLLARSASRKAPDLGGPRREALTRSRPRSTRRTQESIMVLAGRRRKETRNGTNTHHTHHVRGILDVLDSAVPVHARTTKPKKVK